MSRSMRLYLEDILTSCAKVRRYTQGMTFQSFQADDRTYDAVVRNLQIIGEAVQNIPQVAAIAVSPTIHKSPKNKETGFL